MAQNCEQKLKLANKYYQEGKIELIIDLLKPCLAQQKLDKKQILEAFDLTSNAFYLMDSIESGSALYFEYSKSKLNIQNKPRPSI